MSGFEDPEIIQEAYRAISEGSDVEFLRETRHRLRAAMKLTSSFQKRHFIDALRDVSIAIECHCHQALCA